jgi:hypothetical protein
MFFFLSFVRNWRTGRWKRSYLRGKVGTSEKEEVAGKVGRRVNTGQKMCIHECKCKKRPVETVT